uniref:Cytochrome c oxidase polypeptide VIIc n=1 Tax=Parastrongyloides trichosuri TaxID=131310 RepID=A0A0N4ZZ23_PARTI
MISRPILVEKLFQSSVSSVLKRNIHKGSYSTPPMRFTPYSQKIAFLLFIFGTCLSYPTYVCYNLDNLRPRHDIGLSPTAAAELEKRKAARQNKN